VIAKPGTVRVLSELIRNIVHEKRLQVTWSNRKIAHLVCRALQLTWKSSNQQLPSTEYQVAICCIADRDHSSCGRNAAWDAVLVVRLLPRSGFYVDVTIVGLRAVVLDESNHM
jgi:hypothetical protein